MIYGISLEVIAIYTVEVFINSICVEQMSRHDFKLGLQFNIAKKRQFYLTKNVPF
jgi:hypothetical protein